VIEKALRRASRQLPGTTSAVDASSEATSAVQSLPVSSSSSASLSAPSEDEKRGMKRIFVRLEADYARFLGWYYNHLPPVRLKSYQDLVLRLVIIRFEVAQLFRAVQIVRKENPNKFTIRALLILCGVAFLGNALGTFLVVYFSTFAALLAPPFLMYNMTTRLLKLAREAISTLSARVRGLFSSRSKPLDPDHPTVAAQDNGVDTQDDLGDHSDDSDMEPADRDSEREHTRAASTTDPVPVSQHWTDDIKAERALLASSAPVGDLLMRPPHMSSGSDGSAVETELQSSSEEMEGHRVLLPGRRVSPAPAPANVPPLELGTLASSSLSTSPNDKRGSPSNFIGLLKRNLSGALKKTQPAPPAPEPSKGHAALKKAQRRTVQLGATTDDAQRPPKTSLETEVEELVASPSMLRPRRVTKRRRSGSIEPMMLVASSDVALSRNRSADDDSIMGELDRLRSVPSSPVLSPRLGDRDSDSMAPRVPKIPLVLLRGSRDDSVIQTPRHRP
jgi:hypothetical protein